MTNDGIDAVYTAAGLLDDAALAAPYLSRQALLPRQHPAHEREEAEHHGADRGTGIADGAHRAPHGGGP